MFTEKSPLLPLGPHQPLIGPLTLPELMKYAEDPCWVRVRRCALLVICVTWFSLMVAALTTARAAPSCGQLLHADTQTCGLAYQLLAPLYRDQDGDGWGDLQGLRSRLDYIAGLGVHTIWLSPIFRSPMKDFGYDISDFRDIDPIFGTMADFDELVVAAKSKGLKLVLDFVPNHSSDEHEWFVKSVAREEPYTDYYVWAESSGEDNKGTPLPPNNWLSVFGGSAWEYSPERKQFYLHQFALEQPDLNFRNPAVLQEMKGVLTFWLDKGVDGFRMDAVPHLFEDPELRDEPRSDDLEALPEEYAYLKHVHTHNLPEVPQVLRTFRQLLDQYANDTDGVRRVMMAEVYDTVENTMLYYGDQDEPIADFPFNFKLVSELNTSSSAKDMLQLVNSWMNNMPEGACANWVLGNHDKGRVATRLGPGLVDALNMVILLLPGTAVTYYGEEIGMEDAPVSWHQTVDPAGRNAGPERFARHSRDPARSPMQWTDEVNAGFSSGNSTWLPVNPNYKQLNVEVQEEGHSHLNVYRALVQARATPALKYGSLDTKVLAGGTVFAFTRTLEGAPAFLVAINLSQDEVIVDLSEFPRLPLEADLYTSSVAYRGDSRPTIVDTTNLALGPQDGVVLSYTLTS